jgi:hypothetical protein
LWQKGAAFLLTAREALAAAKSRDSLSVAKKLIFNDGAAIQQKMGSVPCANEPQNPDNMSQYDVSFSTVFRTRTGGTWRGHSCAASRATHYKGRKHYEFQNRFECCHARHRHGSFRSCASFSPKSKPSNGEQTAGRRSKK